MLPLKVGIKAATSSLTGVLLFRGGPGGGWLLFLTTLFVILHSSKALKVHFLLCERRFFVLFLSSTVASQGRHYFVPVTERRSAGLQCSQTIDCLR